MIYSFILLFIYPPPEDPESPPSDPVSPSLLIDSHCELKKAIANRIKNNI